MRCAAVFLLALACNGTGDSGDTEDTDTGETDVDTEDTDTGEGPTGLLSGRVLDASGNGIAGAYVNMCRTVCTTTQTDATGAYAFIPLPPATYSLHVEPPDGQALGEPLVPFSIADGDDVTVDVTLPPLSAPVALPAVRSEIAVGDLYLTTALGELTVPFEDDPTEVAVATAALDKLPPLSLTGTVVAAWYPQPYEAAADPAVTVRIRDAWDLPAGETYALYAADYWSYSFVRVGEFTVDSSGEWLTSTSSSIGTLYTLVLVDETP